MTFYFSFRSSTLENWAREFARFCPTLEVQTYYGSQAERFELSSQFLNDNSLDVVLTTYQIASGTNKDDRKFLKRMKFQVRPALVRLSFGRGS